MAPFDGDVLLVTHCNCVSSVPFPSNLTLKNTVNLKFRFRVTHSAWAVFLPLILWVYLYSILQSETEEDSR